MNKVLILGASSDIAQSISYKYAEMKYELIIAARNVERLNPLKTDIESRFSSNVENVEFDILDFASHESFYNNLPFRPDIVINVCGYMGNQNDSFNSFSESSRVVNTNYLGAMSILNIVASDFMKQRNGVIVGISSVAGDRGRKSNYSYGSAKAGFTAYLSGLRNQLCDFNVHVCTVKPGFVDTQMTKDLQLPKILTASPEEVASDIIKAISKRKNVLYTKWFWKYIMLVIKIIPESMFKRLNL